MKIAQTCINRLEIQRLKTSTHDTFNRNVK